ncbi:uncharacterized protein L201_007017 [Kwoniella dendrophila CBS 6074]|uniref:Prephenate dehydratase domain-containing protein n=1 Tax=Kwoniella dendrophila CBS 6074 TaxID=1295534 RepID=A0AAX4K4F4_9TREE
MTTNDASGMGEPSTKRQKTEQDGQRIHKMAYLGPPGTYGQMAASAFASCYDEPIDLVPCSSISAIWETSSSFHVFPIENTIHGGVTETLDCLLSNLNTTSPQEEERESSSSLLSIEKRKRRIIADLALPISHVLVVRKGVKKEDIKWIRSHEQALGQSSNFIKSNYPLVKLKTYPSTAGAAISLLNPTNEDIIEGQGAALCSKAAAKLYENDLDVLYEGTQGISNNFTRFILLANTHNIQIPQPTSHVPSPSPTEFYTLPSSSDIITLFQSRHIRNIHSRPNKSLLSLSSSSSPSSSSTITKEMENGSIINQPWIYREERFPTLYFVEIDSITHNSDEEISSLSSKQKAEEKGWYLGKSEWRVTDEQINSL